MSKSSFKDELACGITETFGWSVVRRSRTWQLSAALVASGIPVSLFAQQPQILPEPVRSFSSELVDVLKPAPKWPGGAPQAEQLPSPHPVLNAADASGQYYPEPLYSAAPDVPGCDTFPGPAYPQAAKRPCAPTRLGPQPCAHPPERRVEHIYLPQPICDQPAVSQPAQQPPPAGAFVAPPQAGTVVEGERSLTLRGLSITFPTIKLELPSISLPSLIRRERAPRLELDGGVAPYVPGAGVQLASAQMPAVRQLPAQVQQAARAPQPAQAPAPAEQPGKADVLEAQCRQLQERCIRLEYLIEQLVSSQPQVNCLPQAGQCLPQVNHRPQIEHCHPSTPIQMQPSPQRCLPTVR